MKYSGIPGLAQWLFLPKTWGYWCCLASALFFFGLCVCWGRALVSTLFFVGAAFAFFALTGSSLSMLWLSARQLEPDEKELQNRARRKHRTALFFKKNPKSKQQITWRETLFGRSESATTFAPVPGAAGTPPVPPQPTGDGGPHDPPLETLNLLAEVELAIATAQPKRATKTIQFALRRQFLWIPATIVLLVVVCVWGYWARNEANTRFSAEGKTQSIIFGFSQTTFLDLFHLISFVWVGTVLNGIHFGCMYAGVLAAIGRANVTLYRELWDELFAVVVVAAVGGAATSGGLVRAPSGNVVSAEIEIGISRLVEYERAVLTVNVGRINAKVGGKGGLDSQCGAEDQCQSGR